MSNQGRICDPSRFGEFGYVCQDENNEPVYEVHPYWKQRARVTELEAEVLSLKQRIAELESLEGGSNE